MLLMILISGVSVLLPGAWRHLQQCTACRPGALGCCSLLRGPPGEPLHLSPVTQALGFSTEMGRGGTREEWKERKEKWEKRQEERKGEGERGGGNEGKGWEGDVLSEYLMGKEKKWEEKKKSKQRRKWQEIRRKDKGRGQNIYVSLWQKSTLHVRCNVWWGWTEKWCKGLMNFNILI